MIGCVLIISVDFEELFEIELTRARQDNETQAEKKNDGEFISRISKGLSQISIGEQNKK